MTPAERHALEKLLADVAGVEVEERIRIGGGGSVPLRREVYWWCYLGEWKPLDETGEGPARLNLVKAGLRKEGCLYTSGWYYTKYEAWVGTRRDYMGPADGEFGFSAESESMALALAVKALKKSQ